MINEKPPENIDDTEMLKIQKSLDEPTVTPEQGPSLVNRLIEKSTEQLEEFSSLVRKIDTEKLSTTAKNTLKRYAKFIPIVLTVVASFTPQAREFDTGKSITSGNTQMDQSISSEGLALITKWGKVATRAKDDMSINFSDAWELSEDESQNEDEDVAGKATLLD